MIHINSYSRFSRSARSLNEAINGTPRLPRSFPTATKLLVNWGATTSTHYFPSSRTLNPPQNVRQASDKLKAFKALKGYVNIPEYTTSLEEAVEWAKNSVVFGRSLKGTGGSDIAPSDTDEVGFYTSQFWTKYIKKSQEFRVHVMGGEARVIQRKALRVTNPDTGEPLDTSEVDFRIRNLVNGFVFTTSDASPHPTVLEQAVKAVNRLGLDFGAVDVIWNEYYGKAYVLEVNTAPGLEGDTITKYAEYIKEELTKRGGAPSSEIPVSLSNLFFHPGTTFGITGDGLSYTDEDPEYSEDEDQCDCTECVAARSE